MYEFFQSSSFGTFSKYKPIRTPTAQQLPHVMEVHQAHHLHLAFLKSTVSASLKQWFIFSFPCITLLIGGKNYPSYLQELVLE